jgi:hypothetical protein
VTIAAVMTVRNEADVLPLNIAYHRSQGVKDFWIIDNGSTDGTTEQLRAMADVDSGIHWTYEPGPFEQSEFVTGLAHDAHRAGATWVVPTDADEFWWTSHRSLAEALAGVDAGALICQLETFVQASSVIHDDPRALLLMVYRASPRGTADDARDLVEAGEIAFVEMAYPPKLLLRPSSTLTIGMGNHAAGGQDGPMETSTEISVLHVPIRSRDRLDANAETGRRIAATNPDPGTGWHTRRWAAMQAEGRLDEEWPANSYRRGALTINGVRRRCVRDDRIRNAVSPLLEPKRRRLDRARSSASRFLSHFAE